MRLVRLAAAFRAGNASNEHPPVLNAHVVGRDAILFVPRLALTRPVIELLVIPGAHHVVAVECALPEGPSDVVADAGDRAEQTTLIRQRDRRTPENHLLHRLQGKFIRGTYVDPRFGLHVYSSIDARIDASGLMSRRQTAAESKHITRFI